MYHKVSLTNRPSTFRDSGKELPTIRNVLSVLCLVLSHGIKEWPTGWARGYDLSITQIQDTCEKHSCQALHGDQSKRVIFVFFWCKTKQYFDRMDQIWHHSEEWKIQKISNIYFLGTVKFLTLQNMLLFLPLINIKACTFLYVLNLSLCSGHQRREKVHRTLESDKDKRFHVQWWHNMK